MGIQNTNDKHRQVEKILYDYKFIKGYIEFRKQDLQELEYQGVQANMVSEIKSCLGKHSDPVSMEYELIEKQKAQLTKIIEEKEKMLSKVDLAYTLLNDLEQRIVKKIFFEAKRIRSVASELSYSEVHIKRLKKGIIDKVSLLLFN